MTHDRIREAAPVQVYLDAATQNRLDRLVGSLGTSKSDVLRRGLMALERELTDPAAHPALLMAGFGVEGTPVTYDAAREHDEVMAAVHEGPASSTSRKGGRRKRG